MSKAKSYCVYMLEMKNGSYYTGYTNNIKRRFQEHIKGTGGKYTRVFQPVAIAQCWKIKGSQGDAMKVESYIKRQPRKKKEVLIVTPRKLKKDISKALEYDFKIRVFNVRSAVLK